MAHVILDEEKREVKGGKLDLHSMNIRDITEIEGLKTLSDLEVLYLDRNKISEISGLEELKKLRVLELSKNLITEIKGLETLINLQWLNLRNNQIEESKGLSLLHNLKILNISGNKITEIKGLNSLINLQELNFSNNEIMEISGLENTSNLQEIELSNNKITEIKGLENLKNLQELVLTENQISEIKGLEKLTKLRVLELGNNQITHVKGLESLTNLKFLNLKDNQIPRKLLEELEGLNEKGYVNNPQRFVEYCQQRLKAEKEAREKIRSDTIQYIKKLPEIYNEITFDKIISKTRIEKKELESLIENMILSKDIDAQISGETLIFKREVAKSLPRLEEMPKLSQYLRESTSKNVRTLRGGNWKIEGDHSVFHYKVKIKNVSQYIISDIQVIFGDVPPGLELRGDKLIEFSKLRPNHEVAPTYKLYATDNCVGSEIKGIVHYSDHFGQIHTITIEPFEIHYVCNLLVPKTVSREEFEGKIEKMEGKTIVIDSSLNPRELVTIVKRNIEDCNFALLKEIKEAQIEGFRRIEGLARGLYDKQDVAISVALRQVEEGSEVEIKTLSDKIEKTTDLMRDISIKLEDIKSNTQKVQDIIYYLDESKIRETLNLIIENPKDLNRVINKIIKNPELSNEEKDKWASVVKETLEYYELFEQPKWLKFIKGISKIVLGKAASEVLTDGVEHLVNWINAKVIY